MTSPKTGRPLSSAGDLSGVPAPEFALVLVRARWRRDLVLGVCLRAAARPGPPAPPPPQGFVAAVASLIPVSRPLFSAGSSGYVVDPSVRVTILCGWIERKPGIPGERTAFWKPENEGPTAARTAWHHTLLRLPVLARALFQRARGAQTVCDNIVLGISHTPDLCNQNTWLPRVVASCVFVSFRSAGLLRVAVCLGAGLALRQRGPLAQLLRAVDRPHDRGRERVPLEGAALTPPPRLHVEPLRASARCCCCGPVATLKRPIACAGRFDRGHNTVLGR